jgi:glycerol-3-phosphate dehydrogenase
MCLNTLFTASVNDFIPGMHGATLCNYTEMTSFSFNENGKINGAVVRDTIDGQSFNVKAKIVVNCAGVHADEVRKMAESEV